MITIQQLRNLDAKKIYSLKKQIGKLATLTEAKYYKCNIYNSFIIITRTGILNYFGEAQKAQIYGKKGKDYKEFKTASAAAKYLNSLS